MTDRGQLYTLEGIAAGLIIMLGLFFALQATTATPGAAGTLNPHAEQQDRASVQSVMNSMNESTLRDATLYWEHAGSNSESFHCTPTFSSHYPGYSDIEPAGTPSSCDDGEIPDRYKHGSPAADREYDLPPNEFGKMLNERFGEGYSYNVIVRYHDSSASSGFGEQLMVYQGQPDSSAVRASASVTLMDDHNLLRPNSEPSSIEVQDSSSNFYAPDEGSSEYYNRLTIEVFVWRG